MSSPDAPSSNPSTPAASDAPRVARRLWLPLAAVLLTWASVLLPPRFFPGEMAQLYMMQIGPLLATLVFLFWWFCLSGLSWKTRWLGLGIVLAAIAIALVVVHPTMRMGMLFIGFPLVLTAWWAAIAVTRNSAPKWQGWAMALGAAAAFGYMALIRVAGVNGAFDAEVDWRWKKTAEDVFLAEHRPAANLTHPLASAPLEIGPGDWPGFRGPERDGMARGVSFNPDWASAPPTLKWKRRIGPGWSSFAVIGDRLFTQEQRGELEVIVCYDANSGDEIWSHGEKDRFEEPIGGAGPRATPTIDATGRLYALGGNGTLICLDAASGAKHWSADIKADSGAAIPTWGFSSSPLVVDGKVLVHTGAGKGKSVLAYDANDGKLLWASGDGGHSYCSLQKHEIDGVPQAVICTETGVESFDIGTGAVLWRHDWTPQAGVARIVQPALVGGDRVIIGTGLGVGSRALKVSHNADGWKTEPDWTTTEFKPYFNDFVVVDSLAYGFDGTRFCCVDLATGKRLWKGGRYGSGQVVGLPDMNLLFVVSEQGELVLIEPNPERLVEKVKLPGIEGKTWNHPVFAHGKLFLRNGEEMACFEVGGATPEPEEASPETQATETETDAG